MLVLKGHRGKVRDLKFSPDGSLLASVADDCTAMVWETGSWQLRSTFKHRSKSPRKGALQGEWSFQCLSFDPDGEHLATGGYGIVLVWNLNKRSVVALRQISTVGVGFGHQGRSLFGMGYSGVYRWNPWKSEAPSMLTEECCQSQVGALAISPDGKTVATPHGYERWVDLWNGKSGGPIGSIPQRLDVQAIAFSPDGRELAVGCHRDLYVWDVPTEKLRLTLPRHGLQVNSLAYSPDGRILASAGNDGVVHFWDAASGGEITTFDWALGQVRAIAFAPDGMTIAAGGKRRGMVVWDVDV